MAVTALALAVKRCGSQSAPHRQGNRTADPFPLMAGTVRAAFPVVALTLVTGVTAQLPRLPVQGTPYATMAAVAVLAVLAGRPAARSWRGRPHPAHAEKAS